MSAAVLKGITILAAGALLLASLACTKDTTSIGDATAASPTEQALPPRSVVTSPTASPTAAPTCRNDKKVVVNQAQPGRPFKMGNFTVSVSPDVRAYTTRTRTDPTNAYSSAWREAKSGELIRVMGVIVTFRSADAPLRPEDKIQNFGLEVNGTRGHGIDTDMADRVYSIQRTPGQSGQALFSYEPGRSTESGPAYQNISEVPKESLVVFFRFQPGLLQRPRCDDYVEWQVTVR